MDIGLVLIIEHGQNAKMQKYKNIKFKFILDDVLITML